MIFVDDWDGTDIFLQNPFNEKDINTTRWYERYMKM